MRRLVLVFLLTVASAPSGWSQVGIPQNGLQLWLRADTGITKDAENKISLWQDQSGNLNHAYQEDANAQPSFVPDGGRGAPTVQFDGFNSFLNLPAGFKDFTSGLTIIIVTKPTSYQGGDRFITFGNGPNDAEINFSQSGTDVTYGGAYDWVLGSNALEIGNTQIVTVVHASDGTCTFFRNGVICGTQALSLPTDITRTIGYIGKSLWDGDAMFEGTIAEILVYNRGLSPEEQAAAEAVVGGRNGVLPPPVISKSSGVYNHPITVTLSTLVPDGAICYTLDGSEPSSASTRYTIPLTFTASALIKAAVIKDSGVLGDVSSAEYRLYDGRSGKVVWEYWKDYSIDSFLNTSAPGSPTNWNLLTSFEGPQDIDDNYAARYRGYVIPPASGYYTFYLSSDDGSRLYLSTNYDPANKQLIAQRWEWSGFEDWDGATKTSPIYLFGGQHYYIEALHEEGGGGDHCEVGWKLADGTLERPIPGERLEGYSEDDLSTILFPPTISLKGGLYNSAQTITLSSNLESSQIHYTLDGSEPDESSPLYNGPITISATTTLKVKTFAPGQPASPTITTVFIVDTSIPIPVADLDLWLRADQSASITQDENGRVSTWKNSVEALPPYLASQSETTSQPIYTSNAINGKPALKFDGYSQFIPVDPSLYISNPSTVFVVYQSLSDPNNTDENYNGFWNHFVSAYAVESVTNSFYWRMGQAGSDNRQELIAGGYAGTNVSTTSLSGRAFVNEAIADYNQDGLPISRYFINGWESTVNTYRYADAGQLSLGGVWAYYYVADGGYSAPISNNCYIAEVIVYHQALSDADRQKVESYLNSKYGLVQKAPAPTISADTTGQISLADGLLGAEIHYTTDGSEPSATSPVYHSVLNVSTATVIKAKAVIAGYTDSDTTSFKYETASPIPSSGLRLWLKGDGGMVKDSTGRVSRWIDLSGNGNDAVQLEEGRQPLLQENAMASSPALLFDGTLNFLRSPLSVSDRTTTFVVFQPKSTVSGPAIGTTAGYVLGQMDNKILFQDNWNHVLGSEFFWFSSSYVGKNFMAEGVLDVLPYGDGSQSYGKFVLNQTEYDYMESGVGGGQFIVGGLLGNSDPDYNANQNNYLEESIFSNSLVAEVLIYDTPLGDEDRKAVETYLMQKYGIISNPPVASPAGGTFKTAQAVTLSNVPANATARYTLNGNDPSASSDPYSGSIAIAATSTLKVQYFFPDGTSSGIASYSFIIDPNLGITTDGLALWLTAGTGVISDSSGLVDQWVDQSGRGMTASQATDSFRPVYHANATNNRPAITFDGNTSFLQCPSGFADFTSGITIIVVANPTGESYQNNLISFDTNSWENDILLVGGDSDVLHFQLGTPWYSRIAVLDSPSGANGIKKGAYQIITADYDGSNQITLYNNGTILAQGRNDGDGGAIPNIRRTHNYIGKRNDSGYPAFQGDIAEVLVYNRKLTTTERQQLGFYLSSKYGIALATPQLSLHGGIFKTTQSVTVTVPEGYQAYYTLDGSEPSTASTLYNGPISISSSVTLKVRYFVDGTPVSGTATENFIIDPSVRIATEGLSLWLKTDAGVTTNSSGLVSQWEDQSGKGSSASQANSSAQPTWVASALNGMPVLRFDGNSDFLQMPAGFDDFSAGITIMIVTNPTALAQWERFITFGNGPNDKEIAFGRYSNTNNLYFNNVVAENAIELNKNQVFTVTQIPNSTTNLYKNGLLVGTGTESLPESGIRNLNYIGKSQWDDPLFQGDIAEIIVYNRALSDSEREQNESYLYDRYQILPKVNTPVITPASGFYENSVTVTLSAPMVGTVIHYTTDATDPTEQSAIYAGALTFTQSGQIKARGFVNGYQPSDIVSASYQVGTAVGTGDGLAASYFVQEGQQGTSIRRIDPIVDFYWDQGSPDARIPSDNFSARWEGKLVPRFTETYSISTFANNGMKVWVNGQLLFDHDIVYDYWASASIPMVRGQEYDIKVEYVEHGDVAEAHLYWSSPSVPQEIIPQSQLYSKVIGGFTATPQADPAPGTFPKAVTVALTSATPGAEIYYTLDGNDPDENSPVYAGPFQVSATTTVKARTYATGKTPGGILVTSYTIDTSGPTVGTVQFSGGTLNNGFNLTNSGPISVTASDPNGISRVEFYLDGTLIGTDTTAADGYNALLNALTLTDGNHTLQIKIYDNFGNVTTQSYDFTETLPVPPTPTITAPNSGITTAATSVTIQGTAQAGSQIVLYRNDQSLGTATVTGATGTFSTTVTLMDGANAIAVSAKNRSGEGAKSGSITINRDANAPAAPGGLQGSSQAGGFIQLSWSASAGSSIKGYNVYRSTSAFTEVTQATKVTAAPVTTLGYGEQPSADGSYFYRVTAVSLADVESTPSNQVQVSSDRVLPSASIIYSPQGVYDSVLGRYGVGIVNVTVSMSEKLVTAPFLSIKPASGQLISVPLTIDPADPQKYTGSFAIQSATPTGAAIAILSSRDVAGNRGAEITQGQGITIDTAGPDVTDLSISPSQSIQNDASAPVLVTFIARLNSTVKPDTLPQFKYTLSKTSTAPLIIADVAPVLGDNQSYAFSVQLPAQAGTTPETLTISYHAEDDLGNVSENIVPIHAFQIYQGTLPGLDPPAGLTAQSLPNGQVKLTWLAVANAADYQIYRRTQNGTAQAIQRSTGLLTYTDSPDVDGTYNYSIATVRHENSTESIGTPSGEIQGVSDRLAPTPPSDLAITLANNGVRIAWAASTASEQVSYRLYRASSPIGSITGLTPLTDGVSSLSTVDVRPNYDASYYAVVAVDRAGNISSPISGYFNSVLLPPLDLVVTTTDGGNPQLSWFSATGLPVWGTLAGFNVYLGPDDQKTKLNTTGIIAGTQFMDTGYSGDERRYTIVSVDDQNAESIGHTVTLPKLEFELQSGATLKRGLMNHLTYRVKNPGAQAITNAQIHAQVNGIDHISSVFSIAPNTELTQSVVVGGYSTLPDTAQIVSTLQINANEGESVRFVRNNQIPVSLGQLTIAVNGSSFTRGGTATVGFTLSNPGSEQIEVLTARNNGATASPEMRLVVLDADGNTLSSQNVNIHTGGTIFTLSNGDSVLRVGPGEEVDSPNISVAIPINASDKIYLALEIDHVYYHLGNADQVTMEGIKTRSQFAVIDTSYYGMVESVTPQESLGDQNITISGHAYNRNGNTHAPKVSLNLKISNQGFERTIPVVTDDNGAFSAVFKPLATEGGGIYNVWANHPDLLDRTVQQTFTIKKLVASPLAADLRIPKNYVQTLSWKVTAGGGTSATQLRVEVVAADQSNGQLPPGITFTPGSTVASLESGQSTNVTATIQASNAILTNSGTLVVRLRSAEDGGTPWTKMTINYAFADAQPALRWSSNTMVTGVSPAQSVTETVTLQNLGLTAAEDVVVKVLNTNGTAAPSWISTSIPAQVGEVAVGAQVPVSVTFAPGATVAEGDYTFILRANGSNHPNVDVTMAVTVSASGQGQVLFHVNDQYTGTTDSSGQVIQGLNGAQITLQNEKVASISLSSPLTTDAAGEALSPALPAGIYKYKVTSDSHDSLTGRVWIRSGATVTQEVNLSFNFVTVEWEVTPTTIQDRYDIVLSATFDTQVPAPVVVVTPGVVNLPAMQKGEVFNGELEITNNGLIAAQNAQLSVPTSDNYFDYQLLASVPTTLAAGETIKVPYRLICKQTLPGAATTVAATGAGALPVLALGFFFIGRRRAARVLVVGFITGAMFIAPLLQQRLYADSGCFGYSTGFSYTYTYICKSGSYSGSVGCAMSYRYGACGLTFVGGPVGYAGWNWRPSGSGGGGGGHSSNGGGGSADTCPGNPNPPDPGGPDDDGCDKKDQKKSWIELVHREYQDSITELKFPIRGGMEASVVRDYENYKWSWEAERTLDLQYATDGSTINQIIKDRARYTAIDSAHSVFGNFSSRIYKQPTGFRWETRYGDWKQYDLQGRLLSTGSRNVTYTKNLYDGGGRLVGIADVNDQQVFWFEYEGTGTAKKAVHDSTGRRVEYEWTNGNLTRVKDVLGRYTSYGYDTEGRITSKTDIDGHSYTIGYQNNAAISFTDTQTGAVTYYNYTYDKNKKQYYIKITAPGGEITEKVFDNDEQLVSDSEGGDAQSSVVRSDRSKTITDGAGNITKNTYNESNDLLNEVAPDGSITTYEYGVYHKATKVSAANGTVTTSVYDDNGNLLTQTENANGSNPRVTSFTYNETNQVVSKTSSNGRKTNYEYNALGLLTREYDSADSSRQTTYTYDARGFRLTKTDALGHLTRYEYDDSGRVTKETNPLGESTVYTFQGTLLKQVETGRTSQPGRILRYNYDSWGRRTQTIRVSAADIEQAIQTVAYDSSGKILSETNASGQATTYEYDSKGQCIAVHRPFNGSSTSDQFTEYDSLGRVTQVTDPLGIVTSSTYDTLGRVKTQTEAVGLPEQRSVTYTYDTAGRQTSVTYLPGGQVTYYSYDALGNRVGISGDREYARTFAYDSEGNLSRETDALGHSSVYTYDIYGQRTGLNQGNGLVIVTYEYDRVGNLIKTTDGRGNSRAIHYDDLNRPIASSVPAASGSLNGSWWTNPSLVAQSMTYNRFGQTESTTTITGATTTAVYDELGRLQSQTDGAGLTLAYYYDALDHVVQIAYPPAPGYAQPTTVLNAYDSSSGQLVSTTDRAGLTTSYTYNARFQRLSEVSSQNVGTGYAYDGLGRLLSTTDYLGNQTVYAYDRFDQTTSVTYPDNKVEQRVYDNYGKLTSQSGAGVYPVTYGYDAAGNRVSLKDGNNSETKWEYDAANRVTRKVYADGKDYAYTYDSAGNLTTRRDSKNLTTTYSYNRYNQISTVDYPNDTDVSFTYDAAGRRIGLTDGSGSTTWTYDSNNRVTGETQSRSGATLTYSYTMENQRSSMILSPLPASGLPSPVSTSYSYDNAGCLAILTDMAVSALPFRYEWKNDAALIESVSNPSGGGWTKTYDKLGRLTNVSGKGSGSTVINNYAYSYNALSQRTQEASTVGTRNYGYDDQRQLISADGGVGYQYGYAFDPIGNRLTATNSGAVASYLPNNVNQYSTITLSGFPQPIVPSYDANGNMISNGKGMTLAYDEENRLKSVSTSSRRSEFVYDGLGRRVERREYTDNTLTKAVRYIYDSNLPVQELESTDGANFTSARHYTRGLDLSGTLQGAGGVGGLLAFTGNSGSYYYFTDGNGNVTDLVDGGGLIAAHYEYSPFGEKTATSGSLTLENPYQWSSKEYHQETGLVYYLYRYFDSGLGRWVSRDLLEEDGGFNLYGYVSNNSTNAVDPLGLVLYAVGGTDSEKDNKHTNRQTNVLRFKQDWKGPGRGEYREGPGQNNSSTGSLAGRGSDARIEWGYNMICEELAKHKGCEPWKDEPIYLVGHSRGGMIVMEVAKKLLKGCKKGKNIPGPIPVKFMGLYDAVDMTPNHFGDAVSDNVEFVAHGMRDPRIGSRASWGNTGTSGGGVFLSKHFFGNHSAMGGDPDEGDQIEYIGWLMMYGFNSGHAMYPDLKTYDPRLVAEWRRLGIQQNEIASREIDVFIRSNAATHGAQLN